MCCMVLHVLSSLSCMVLHVLSSLPRLGPHVLSVLFVQPGLASLELDCDGIALILSVDS